MIFSILGLFQLFSHARERKMSYNVVFYSTKNCSDHGYDENRAYGICILFSDFAFCPDENIEVIFKSRSLNRDESANYHQQMYNIMLYSTRPNLNCGNCSLLKLHITQKGQMFFIKCHENTFGDEENRINCENEILDYFANLDETNEFEAPDGFDPSNPIENLIQSIPREDEFDFNQYEPSTPTATIELNNYLMDEALRTPQQEPNFLSIDYENLTCVRKLFE
jgi:hypothetical protein